MKLHIDTGRNYALALEGGGAKGAYQIGAWKALVEAGVHISAVSGTSVGALNGALIAMGDIEKAEEIWKNIRYSKVMDVDDETMHKLIIGDLRGLDIKAAAAQMSGVLSNRGFDVTPLYNWVKEAVDEDAVRSSSTELYIVTYSLTDRKELELRAKDLAPGALADMLLASAYLPVFRNEPLGGKRYTDGGVRDVLPLHALISNGCRDIIAMRLYGFGVERRVRIPKDVNVHTIRPTIDLGSTLQFDAGRSRLNLRAGYFDAQRLIYGLGGNEWYLDEPWDEARCYAALMEAVKAQFSDAGRSASLRELHEEIIPLMEKRMDVKKGDYRSVFIPLLEAAAEEADLEKWKIYTMDELTEKLREHYKEHFPKILTETLAPKRLF